MEGNINKLDGIIKGKGYFAKNAKKLQSRAH